MRTRFKNAHLVLILCLWPGVMIAQDYIDLVKIDYAITPEISFDSTSSTTILHETNGNLNFPIPLNKNFALLTGITFEMISASFDPGRKDESVLGLTLKLGANIKHNSTWSGTYLFLPKISSDFVIISNQDFQFGGVVLMKHTKSSHLNYKFGLYGNKEFFGPFIVPIFGCYYLSPAKKLEVKALLPLFADLNYSISNEIRVGLHFDGQTRSFHVNTPIVNEEDRYLTKNTNELFSYVQYGTDSGFNFQLGFGRSIGRSYRYFDEKISLAIPLVNFGDNRTQLNTDLADSWLFKVAVFYRLNLDGDSSEN